MCGSDGSTEHHSDHLFVVRMVWENSSNRFKQTGKQPKLKNKTISPLLPSPKPTTFSLPAWHGKLRVSASLNVEVPQAIVVASEHTNTRSFDKCSKASVAEHIQCFRHPVERHPLSSTQCAPYSTCPVGKTPRRNCVPSVT